MRLKVSLTWRARTTATLRWYTRDGVKHSKAIGKLGEITKARAEEIRAEFEEELNRAASRHRGEPFTFSHLLALDLKLTQFDLRPKSQQAVRHSIQKAIAALGPHTDIRTLAPSDVQRIKQFVLIEEKRSLATWGKTLRHARAAVNRAIAHGVLTHNPFAGQRMPQPVSRSDRIISDEELSALLEAAPNAWWRALLLVQVGCGLRLGEALSLRWKDIDHDTRHILIRTRQQTSLRLDHGETVLLPAWTPKSGKNRSVPAGDQVLDVLRDLRHGSDGSPYVFLTLNRLQRISDAIGEDRYHADFPLVNNLQRSFHSIQATAKAVIADRRGCDLNHVEFEPVSFQNLRQRYCTSMSQVLPIHSLAAFAGHADPRTTMQFYLKVSERDEQAVRDAFSRSLSTK